MVSKESVKTGLETKKNVLPGTSFMTTLSADLGAKRKSADSDVNKDHGL